MSYYLEVSYLLYEFICHRYEQRESFLISTKRPETTISLYCQHLISNLNTAMPSVSDIDILGESPDAEVDGLELGVADDVVAGVPPAQSHSQHLGVVVIQRCRKISGFPVVTVLTD